MCLLIRCIKRTVGLVDLAVWPVGLGLGMALGVVRDDRLTVGGFLLIFACMAAGLFVSFRRDKELALQGDRMLESASVAAVATFAGNWLL